MEKAIQGFAAINFLLMGLSHVLRHRAWAELFILLHRQGRAGALAHGTLSLFTGSLIVAFHNNWSGLACVLTVTGWLNVLKSIITLIAPDVELRSLARVRLDNSRIFVGPGAVMMVLGAVFAYCAWRA